MTRDELKAAVRAVNGGQMTVRERDGEIRVNFYGGSESTAYYTNDRDDALATAVDMAQRRTDAIAASAPSCQLPERRLSAEQREQRRQQQLRVQTG